MHRMYVYGIAIIAAFGFGLPANAEMVHINMPTIRVSPSVRVTTPSIAGAAVSKTGALTANSASKPATPANTHEPTQVVELSFQKITTSNNSSNAASKDSWAGSSTGGSTTGATKAGGSKGGPTTARCRWC